MSKEKVGLRMAFDYDAALAKDPNVTQADIDTLRERLLQKDPTKHGIVPKDLTDQQLLLFYHSCYYKIDDAIVCVKNYFEEIANAPEIFDGLRLETEEEKSALEFMEHAYLPKKSPDGEDIVYHRLFDPSVSKFNQLPGIRVMIMTMMALLYERGPAPGVIFLYDMEGVKLAHMTKTNISATRKLLHFVQHALPIRIKAVHVMNATVLLDKIMTILKPFLKKELIQMIKVHLPTEDMEKFYKEILPKECLPTNYGGTLADPQTLNTDNETIIRGILPYFESIEAQRKNAQGRDAAAAYNSVFNGGDID